MTKFTVRAVMLALGMMRLRWIALGCALIVAFACDEESSADDDGGPTSTSGAGGSGGAGNCGAEQYQCDTGCCDCPAVGIATAQQLRNRSPGRTAAMSMATAASS